MGLGVRVQKGDATGYAHVEDLSWDAMKRAAETAAHIAQGGKTIAPLAIERLSIPSRYELDRLSIDVPGVDKRSLLERASRAAIAHDPRIIKAEASFAEEVREILIATSDGRLVHDVQPLMRFGIRAIAEHDGRRESGRSGGGGRMTLGYFDGLSPEWHAEQAAKQALILLDARPAPAGQMEVILAPGDSGILLHEAVGHGLEADFNRKGTSNYTRAGRQVGRERAVHRGGRPDVPAKPRLDQRRRRGRRAQEECPDRKRSPAWLPAGPALGQTFRGRFHGQRPARKLRLRSHAAHDQHRLCWPARTTRKRCWRA